MKVGLGKQDKIRKPAVTIQDPKCPKIAPKAQIRKPFFFIKKCIQENLMRYKSASKKAKAQQLIHTSSLSLCDKYSATFLNN